MIRTRVGYAGGTTPNPSYHNIGDHSETVQVDYNPSRISYEQLLDAFWHSHDPTAAMWSVQYRSVIFYHNDAQKNAALESLQREQVRLGRDINTVIVPYTGFFLAEDYHQKYYLSMEPVLNHDLSLVYPNHEDLVNSTAAARINGYIGGFGDEAAVKAEIDQLGLSRAGQEALLQLAARGLSQVCPAF